MGRRKRKREADLVDRILGAIINHVNPDVPEKLYTTILLQTATGRKRKRKNPLKRRLDKKLQGTQNGIQNPQNQILIMARKRKNPQPGGRRLKESPPKRNRLRKRSKKTVVTTILKIRTLK